MLAGRDGGRASSQEAGDAGEAELGYRFDRHGTERLFFDACVVVASCCVLLLVCRALLRSVVCCVLLHSVVCRALSRSVP